MRHSTNLRWSQLKVGLVVSISVVVVVTAVLAFGHITELFQPKKTITAVFSDVRGLRPGAPVWLGGVEAGYVRGIRFPTQGERFGIEVEMVVDAEMADLIRADSTALVRTQGLLGDIYVEVALGSPSEPPLPDDRPLEGIVPVDIKELVSGSSVTLAEMGRVLRSLSGMMGKIAEGKGSVGRFVNDPALYDELTQLSSESRQLIRQLQKGEGTAGQFLNDPELYHQLTTTADRLASAVASFQQLTDELRQGKGTIGKLATDAAVYDNLATSTARLDRVLARIESGDGVAGRMVADQEMGSELKGAIMEFKAASGEFRLLLEDVREHPAKYFSFSLF
jgi:phospholipid/cholesterol/gamma-HCH transport system substrate-binding protein